jgi:hypothetical protein
MYLYVKVDLGRYKMDFAYFAGCKIIKRPERKSSTGSYMNDTSRIAHTPSLEDDYSQEYLLLTLWRDVPGFRHQLP